MASSLEDAGRQDMNECMAIIQMRRYAQLSELIKTDAKQMKGEDWRFMDWCEKGLTLPDDPLISPLAVRSPLVADDANEEADQRRANEAADNAANDDVHVHLLGREA